MTLSEPIAVGSSAIWTATRNDAGGTELIRIGRIVSIEPVGKPIVELPGTNEAAIELEGDEEWLSTVNERESNARTASGLSP